MAPPRLRVRDAQMEAFRAAGIARTETRLLAHTRRFFDERHRELGDDGMQRVVRHAMTRARRHGLRDVASSCIYLDVMLLLGSGFDDDPQLGWAQAILRDEALDGWRRARHLMDHALSFLDRSEGADNEHLEAALDRIIVTPLERLLPPCGEAIERYVEARLSALHPARFEAVGPFGIAAVIRDGRWRASAYGLTTPQGAALFTGLLFMLGAAADADPQIPWVAEALAVARSVHDDDRVRLVHRVVVRHAAAARRG